MHSQQIQNTSSNLLFNRRQFPLQQWMETKYNSYAQPFKVGNLSECCNTKKVKLI